MVRTDGPFTSCSQIEARIEEFQKYYAYDDALFIADLYHERLKTNDSLTVYADCLMKSGKTQELYGLLYPHTDLTPRLRYIFAKSCFDINKLDDCQSALIDSTTGELYESLAKSPVAPYARVLLSTILCDSGSVPEALNQATQAIKESEMMWSAVKKHVLYGGKGIYWKLDEQYRRVKEDKGHSDYDKQEEDTVSTHTDDTMSVGSDEFSTVKARRSARVAATPRKTTKTPEKKTPATSSARSSMGSQRKSSRINEMESRRLSNRQPSNRMLFGSDTENAGGRGQPPRTRASVGGTPTATSERIQSRAATQMKPTKSPTLRKREVKLPLTSKNSNSSRVISMATRTRPMQTEESSENRLEIENVSDDVEEKPFVDDVRIEDVAVSKTGAKKKKTSKTRYSSLYKETMELFMNLACMEEAIGTYAWADYKNLLDGLDRRIVQTSQTVCYLRARACFEQNEYEEAKALLDSMHQKNPDRVEGTELLSTALWHLQNTQELSALAQKLTSMARDRPQSWCVAGNCFSLQRQHTQAVECLERALQLDPRFAYAHALLGHELVVQDELDRAAASFRSALRLAPYDYRSWHGLGLVHLKKEQLGLAELNMTKAVTINPTSRALLCTLSQVNQSLGKSAMAMELAEKALALNPEDVACRFNRARLLFETKQNEKCLEELKQLRQSSPDEAFVFHLLARVERRLGNTHLALLNYSWAAELDPRGEQGMPGTSTDSNAREEYEDDEYSSL